MKWISIAVRVEKLPWHDLAGYVVGNLRSFSQKKRVLDMNPSLIPAVRLPPAGAAIVIPFAIALCFVLGVLGWWLAVHREAKAVPWCYERKFVSQSSELRVQNITKISGGEIRQRTGECACNLIRKFRFSLLRAFLIGTSTPSSPALLVYKIWKFFCCPIFWKATDVNHFLLLSTNRFQKAAKNEKCRPTFCS